MIVSCDAKLQEEHKIEEIKKENEIK